MDVSNAARVRLESASGGPALPGKEKARWTFSDGTWHNPAGHAPPGRNRSAGPAVPPPPPPPPPAPEATASPADASASPPELPPPTAATTDTFVFNFTLPPTSGTIVTSVPLASTATTFTLATAPRAGTLQTVADFGIVTINGVTTYLGALQAPYMTAAEGAKFVAGALNANPLNTVTATVDPDGRLSLTSKDGTSPITIDRAGVSTTGDAGQLVDLGLATGTYGSSVVGLAPTSPYFADAFELLYDTFRTQAESSAG